MEVIAVAQALHGGVAQLDLVAKAGFQASAPTFMEASQAANRLNDESIIILGDLDASDPAVHDRQQRLGQFALNEIDRNYPGAW